MAFSTVIAGHDLQAGGADALALGGLIADASAAGLVVASVAPRGDQQAELADRVGQIAAAADAQPECVLDASPARGLENVARATGADLIVVGSSRYSGFGEIIAGNVGRALLKSGPCALAIAPSGFRNHASLGLSRVLVAVDGSPESGRALNGAIELAQALGIELKLIAVAEPPNAGCTTPAAWRALSETIEQDRRGQLEAAIDQVPADASIEATLVSGDPGEKIRAAAASPGTLLVLGSRSHGPLRRVVLGSVSTALARTAPCPLLIYPRAAVTAAARKPAAAA